ncbi:MAG TPA: metallophosphoesterase [Thermoanaerobaculia bacterium]|nr:metallophosphoesterase [Thermoanaerobaculia bacterium]
MRTAVVVIIALAILATFDVVAVVALWRLHPRRRALIAPVAIFCNLMWPFLLMLRALTPFSRVVRAVFGPPWFAWISFSIVYVTLMTLIVWTPRAFRVWTSRVLLAIAIVGGAWGFYDAIVPLRVETIPVAIDNLPPEAEGMRIVELADLHVGLFTRPSRLRQFFETIGTLRPDVVVLAGDLVDDDPYFVPKLLRAVDLLDARTPVLAVFGNHEMYGDPLRFLREMRASRVRLLVNEGVAMHGVWIAGMSDFAAQRPDLRPDMARALAGRGALLPIVVAHQPKAFDEARRRAIPLTIVAHTHGGQFGIRPLHWSLAGVFLPYDMGLYRRGASQLYVNTGTGFWLVPFRLGMTGEIAVIELHRR